MINKYHKEIYFPAGHKEALKLFTESLNKRGYFSFSSHAKEQVRARTADLKRLQDVLFDLVLTDSAIFEYKTENGQIKNAVYRIEFDGIKDLILSISKEKTIITMYFNNVNDAHVTLRASEYINH